MEIILKLFNKNFKEKKTDFLLFIIFIGKIITSNNTDRKVDDPVVIGWPMSPLQIENVLQCLTDDTIVWI